MSTEPDAAVKVRRAGDDELIMATAREPSPGAHIRPAPGISTDDASLLAIALDAIIAIDRDGCITEFNPSAERTFGYRRDEVLGRRIGDLIVPAALREAHREGIARVAAGMPPRLAGQHLEMPALHADGSELLIELTVAPPAQDTGIVTAFIRDLTESRRDARRASELHQENTEILNAAGDGIFRLDAEGLACFANPAAERLLGYTIDEVVGQPLHELIHHSHADGSVHPYDECPIRRAASSVPVDVPEDVFWRADGTPLTVAYTAAPLKSDGEPAGAVVVFRDIGERLRMEHRLREQAEHDHLTGLYNRRGFERDLEALVAAPDGRAALLLLDLDHFKFVNDSFGHAVGDELLRTVAQVLLEQVRPEDVICRLGGDEFGVLLPGLDPEAAQAVARRLIAAVERARPAGLHTSASVGVTCFEAGRGPAPGDLLVAADIALYEAKDGGRGRAALFTGRAGTSLTWVERLRAALREDRFVLHSQPIFELRTGQAVHEELLIRMVDEHGGLLSPGSFLPTAETFGLIGEIDRWVLRRGVELAARGRSVHVNLSGHSVGSAQRLVDLRLALAETGADPARLVVELTETLAVANVGEAAAFAGELRALGCRLALDDFGTGFGSFTYLKHLPADYLKIDREFVRDLATSEADRRVVESIVAIAGRFGQRTVAEGVEDDATLAALRAAGVDLAQGYLLGRPAPLDLS